MFKSRLLGKADSLFQHPSGSINLHEFSVEWYELKPRFSDEIYEVNALYFTIAGQELLKHLEDLLLEIVFNKMSQDFQIFPSN